MTIYILQDIETTDDGDLVIDTFGDLKVASPMRTIAQCVNNLLLTDKGDLKTEPSFGANIGSYIGSINNKTTQNLMQMDILQSAEDQGAVIPKDLTVDVIPVDVDKVGVIAEVRGSYLYQPSDGLFPISTTSVDGITMAYIFPFSDGVLRRVDS
jgi:hypothetical protein